MIVTMRSQISKQTLNSNQVCSLHTNSLSGKTCIHLVYLSGSQSRRRKTSFTCHETQERYLCHWSIIWLFTATVLDLILPLDPEGDKRVDLDLCNLVPKKIQFIRINGDDLLVVYRNWEDASFIAMAAAF